MSAYLAVYVQIVRCSSMCKSVCHFRMLTVSASLYMSISNSAMVMKAYERARVLSSCCIMPPFSGNPLCKHVNEEDGTSRRIQPGRARIVSESQNSSVLSTVAG
jgi:hypothetical protein